MTVKTFDIPATLIALEHLYRFSKDINLDSGIDAKPLNPMTLFDLIDLLKRLNEDLQQTVKEITIEYNRWFEPRMVEDSFKSFVDNVGVKVVRGADYEVSKVTVIFEDCEYKFCLTLSSRKRSSVKINWNYTYPGLDQPIHIVGEESPFPVFVSTIWPRFLLGRYI